MCPDQQILSVYIDEELPSPWKEKLEHHLTECSACRERVESFLHFRELLKKDTTIKQEVIKEKVWQKLASRQGIRHHKRIWQRRLSIPLPAAAAAVLIIAFMTVMWFRGGQINNNGMASQQADPYTNANFFLAAEDEVMHGTIPLEDINSVLQYLTSESIDTIIFNLPESRNFYRTGEPAIVRAADYTRR